MTNYERKKNMTIEQMAGDGIHMTRYYEERPFITSDGSGWTSYEKAFRHEIDWLKQEAEDK